MLVYITMIVCVAMFSLFYNKFPTIIRQYDGTIADHRIRKRCYFSPIFLLVLAAFMIPYVIRYHVGTDFMAYYKFYEWHTSYSMDRIMEQTDFGFYLLERVNYLVSDGNWYYHCFIIGLLIYVPILYNYMRFANNFSYAILIYIFFMQYYSGYNAVRQSIAVSLTVVAITLYLDHKRVLALVFLAIAYTFHSSVIIVFVLMLLAMFDYRNKLLTAIKAIMLFSVMVLPSLWGRIMSFLGSMGQDKLVEDYSDVDLSGDKGANFLRIAVYMVPVIIAFVFARKLMEYLETNRNFDDVNIRYMNFMINAVQIATIFMFASMRYWIFARLATYFSVYIPLFLSYSYSVIDKKYQSMYKIISLILFFIYMYMLLPVQSNLLPFRTEWGWNFK